MEQIIYLTNIELAIEMKEAGFDKECVHHLTVHIDAIIYGYGKILETLPNKYKSGIYQLPTLGEIELYEGIAIVKAFFFEEKNYRYVLYNTYANEQIKSADKQEVWYLSELEARCHAWLWANKKEVKNEKTQTETQFEVGDYVSSVYGGYQGTISAWFTDIGGIFYDVDCEEKGSQTFAERDLYLLEKEVQNG